MGKGEGILPECVILLFVMYFPSCRSVPDICELYQCESSHQGPGRVHSIQITCSHHHHPLRLHPDFQRYAPVNYTPERHV